MKLHELKVCQNQPVIDEMPEFSWKVESDAQNELQEKYQIIVKDAQKTVWDSGLSYRQNRTHQIIREMVLASCVDYLGVSKSGIIMEIWQRRRLLLQPFWIKKDWKATGWNVRLQEKFANEYKFGTTYPRLCLEKFR